MFFSYNPHVSSKIHLNPMALRTPNQLAVPVRGGRHCHLPKNGVRSFQKPLEIHYLRKRPQTVWGSGRTMYENVDDDGDDDDGGGGGDDDDDGDENVADDDVEDDNVAEDEVEGYVARMMLRKMRWRRMMLRKRRWRMMMLRMMMMSRGRKRMMWRMMILRRKRMILRMPMRRRTTDLKTALRVLREPAQSKCTWTFHKSYFVSRRFTSGSKSSATDSYRHRLGCHNFTCVRTWLLDAKAEKRRFSSTF